MAFPFLFSIILFSLVSFLFIAYMRTQKTSPSPSSSSSTSCSLPSPSSSSSSSRPPGSNYDVFLSFRGEDTRNTFVGHLYKGLDRCGIYTFKDDEKLKRGKSISPELLKAIQDSRFSIVVLSENYATSSWCLDELVKIIECMDQFEQIVVPIFYNLDPSHVKKQTGSFAKAFAKHEKIFKKVFNFLFFHKTFMEEREKVLRWREALRRVATITGWDSRDRDESMLIEQVVREISDRLFSESSSDDSKLVGMDYHIQKMDSLLYIGSDDVRMVGIWGMGGIGKTTIARAIYDRFSRQYEGRCFIANVKDIFKNHSPTVLQEKLLSEIFLERNLNIYTLDGGFNVIKGRLCHKKVFVVLDDVDNLKQLQTLAEMNDWFGPGSRIIITTRDKHLLVTHGVSYIYEAENLKDDDALLLFKKHAFKQDHPTKDYLELSNRFISYTKGLPLALQVLGSNLYRKTIFEWKSELAKLQRIPNAEIQDVLRISYDGLNDDKQQGLFLHIACFFNGEDKGCVMNILQRCGFFPDIDLGVLIDKSLITISYNQLWVHDLLQEMGREVVRQESVNDPGKRSRLWDPEDVYHVLNHNVGTDTVEGIFLDTSKIKAWQLKSDAFKSMRKLRLLKIYSSDNCRSFKDNCKVHFPQGLEFLSDELRYLYWFGYPLKSLPSNFHPDNLVELNMRYSKLEQLWEGVVHLPNLKRIDLSHFQHLKEIADLSEARKLECLILKGCTSLLEVHSSIQYLNKLIDLNLNNCKDLRSPPETARLESLKNLTLFGCFNIKKSPEILGNVKYLCLDETSIVELLPSIEYAHSLIHLTSWNCKFLARLPNSFSNLKSLQSLTLSGCSKLSELPENFWDLTSLTWLEAEEIGIKLLPSVEYAHSHSLITFNLKNCKFLERLPNSFSNLKSLQSLTLSGCSKLSELPENFWDLTSLTTLEAEEIGIKQLPSVEYAHSHRLITFNLKNCKFLESLPNSFCNLKSLEFLILSGCSKLSELPKNFWDLTSLKRLEAEEIGIKQLPSVEYAHSHRLFTFNLKNCKFLESLPNSFCNLKSLEFLSLSGCSKLLELPENFWDLTSLMRLEADEIGIKLLPSPITHLRRLEKLSLRGYKGEDSTGLLLLPLSSFCSLKDLNLRDCNLSELPKDLGSLSGLSDLDLSRNRFEIIPESIKQLSGLTYLRLGECKRLRSIPRLTSSIFFIDAHNCTSLESVSNSPSRCNFSNCFKLNHNALGSIVADAQEKIQVAVNKFWSEVAANVSSKFSSEVFPPSFFIIYPGSEIPEWFTHREMGSSLTIQLRPHSNSRVAGFAVCVVVAFVGHCDYVCLHLRGKYCHNILDHEIDEKSHPLLWNHVIPVSCVESDHVLVSYEIPTSDRLLDVCNEDSIKISISSCHKGHLHRCKVKRWGYSTFIRPNENNEKEIDGRKKRKKKEAVVEGKL